jgi:glycosidase
MNWDNPNDELLKWYKRLGEIRRGSKMLKEGSFEPIYFSHHAVAYKRYDCNGELLVAVNVASTHCKIQVGDCWDNSYAHFGQSSENGFINLKPYGYTVLFRD